MLTKNKYDDNYSLTTLIQNLFNLNSDISDYEQPRNGEKSTNDSNKNSDNSIKNDTDTQSPKQDKADNQKAPKSNNTKSIHLISNQIRQSQHNLINQIVNQQVTIKQIKNLHRKIINQCQIRL